MTVLKLLFLSVANLSWLGIGLGFFHEAIWAYTVILAVPALVLLALAFCAILFARLIAASLVEWWVTVCHLFPSVERLILSRPDTKDVLRARLIAKRTLGP